MQLVLQGRILTPIITKRASFRLKECQIKIIKPYRRYYNKIIASKPMYPYSLVCYLGEIEARCFCKTRKEIKKKLSKILKIKFIGRFWSEGLGKIRWIKGRIDHSSRQSKEIQPLRKVKIRKGLPDQIPKDLQRLIQYALLHDFYHTQRHLSKIYVEPEITDLELKGLLKQHHNKIDDPLVKMFQYYDRLAAGITRKFRSPCTTRYNWYATKRINFSRLAEEIADVAEHPWKLYEYIYQSKELSLLTESLQHGHSSLQRHLLIVTNLIVQDHLQNKLDLCTLNEIEYRCQHG